MVNTKAILPSPPQVLGSTGVADTIVGVAGSVRVTVSLTSSQKVSVPFLTSIVYVPAESQLKILLGCQVPQFILYSKIPSEVTAFTVMLPSVPPQVVGLLVVVILEILVTLFDVVIVSLTLAELQALLVPTTL